MRGFPWRSSAPRWIEGIADEQKLAIDYASRKSAAPTLSCCPAGFRVRADTDAGRKLAVDHIGMLEQKSRAGLMRIMFAAAPGFTLLFSASSFGEQGAVPSTSGLGAGVCGLPTLAGRHLADAGL